MRNENHFHRINLIFTLRTTDIGFGFTTHFFQHLNRGRDMNNNLRMSGSMCLMLKKSSDRRQQEALENAFKVIGKQYPTVFNM